MGMPSSAVPWTREMVLALPDDGNRYELLDGELLVTPAPRPSHQFAVAALVGRLWSYLRENRIGQVGSAPQISSSKGDRLPSQMSSWSPWSGASRRGSGRTTGFPYLS